MRKKAGGPPDLLAGSAHAWRGTSPVIAGLASVEDSLVFSSRQFRNPVRQPLAGVLMTVITWSFRWEGAPEAQEWSEALPPTDLTRIRPFRRVRAGMRSRNIPARPWSQTVGRVLDVESGVEHDLVRKLDRDPTVEWMVPQPCRVSWVTPSGRKSHIPDLMSVDASSLVTIWDARPTDKQDAEFREAVPVTSPADSWSVRTASAG